MALRTALRSEAHVFSSAVVSGERTQSRIMEYCSRPRWGLEAPDPIDLILKEKMEAWGLRPQTGLGGSPFFFRNCRVLWRQI